MSGMLALGVGILLFALWQMFGGGGPPRDGPGIRDGYDG